MRVIEQAPDLLKNGYQVIPITSKGVPLVSDHLKPETTYIENDGKSWCVKYPEAGVALVAGKNDVYSLDFDVEDIELVRSLKRIIKRKWPTMPFRTCNHPRFAIVFRADRTLQKRTNGHSNGYKLNGKLNQIELIGKRIITILGKHREKPFNKYRWHKQGRGLADVHVDDLPVLTLSHVEKLFKYYEGKQKLNNIPAVSRGAFSRHHQETTFENIQIQRKYADHELQDMLDNEDGESRDDWIRMGQALHAYYNASAEGLRIWDEWSARFSSYTDTKSCRTNWNSFKVDGGVTMTTIERRVKRAKKPKALSPEDELQSAIDNFVYIEKSNQIGNLDRSVGESLLPLQHMKNSYANLFVERTKTDGRDGKETTKMMNVFELWWRHIDRQKVHAVDYVPMNNRLISPDHWQDSRQMQYYNAYVPPDVKRSDNTDLVHFFVEHMKHLFPDNDLGDGQPTNFQIAMNWFAQIVQQPWERHRVALYSICTNHGMGRGWLVNLNNLLFGTDNVSTIPTMDEIIRPNGKNGYLYRTVLLNVNEVSCKGDDRFKISDRLKTLLSDDKQAIDIKWGEQNYGVQIYTRMFAQANGVGDMVIDEDDTRFTVCINRNKPQSKEYYVQLYKLLNKDTYPDFLNQVYTYLTDYEVNLSWLQEAPMTKDKMNVIKSNKSETALAFYEFKTLVGKNLFTDNMLHEFLTTHASVSSNESSSVVNVKQLSVLTKDQYLLSKRYKIGERIVVLHSFHGHNVSKLVPLVVKKSMSKVNKLIKQFFKI